ncbi:hypothetical protein GCM10027169_10040 [Gordonia jinhuaensis]|uniref:Uncharacterized protein n=1 Tax=Gordonia jinhuaensis TaxID=1517702 RepID=A0A916WPX4_9ACTN|nr:hypothetical protein [Gordonia jinhuaensis]GGB19262.1 hypothetical protein GCM10011489_04200 [Gordonia jinhuaensis]
MSEIPPQDTHDHITVFDASDPSVDDATVRALMRELVVGARGRGGRTWLVMAQVPVDGVPAASDSTASDADTDTERVAENARALAHDAIGRQAVRLAVDKVIAVGAGRTARALHQGAVMEGSWGDEAALAETAESATALLTDQLDGGDLVLMAGEGTRPVLEALGHHGGLRIRTRPARDLESGDGVHVLGTQTVGIQTDGAQADDGHADGTQTGAI